MSTTSKHLCRIGILIVILWAASTDVFTGKEKVYSLLEKHGARYLDDLFRYLGLMGLLAFMKAVSSKCYLVVPCLSWGPFILIPKV